MLKARPRCQFIQPRLLFREVSDFKLLRDGKGEVRQSIWKKNGKITIRDLRYLQHEKNHKIEYNEEDFDPTYCRSMSFGQDKIYRRELSKMNDIRFIFELENGLRYIDDDVVNLNIQDALSNIADNALMSARPGNITMTIKSQYEISQENKQESKPQILHLENVESFSAQGNADLATMEIVKICNRINNSEETYLQIHLALNSLFNSQGNLLKCLSLKDLAEDLAANLKVPQGHEFKNFLIDSLVRTLYHNLDARYIFEIVNVIKKRMEKVFVTRRILRSTLKAIYKEANDAYSEIMKKRVEKIEWNRRMCKIISTKPQAIKKLFLKSPENKSAHSTPVKNADKNEVSPKRKH